MVLITLHPWKAVGYGLLQPDFHARLLTFWPTPRTPAGPSNQLDPACFRDEVPVLPPASRAPK